MVLEILPAGARDVPKQPDLPVGSLRAFAGILEERHDHRSELGVDGLDACNVRIHRLDRGESSGGDGSAASTRLAVMVRGDVYLRDGPRWSAS